MITKRVPRILLVDSEAKWSQAVKAALEERGKYQVESVTDIETAVHSSYGDSFDLILINAVLAFGEDIPKFKEIVRRYTDRVLVISDVRSLSTAIRVFKMGADYAEKPFEPRRVIELVASSLQQAYGTAS
ncbi:MAG: response regulator transcription factor [Chloroflexi bacterium]|nr:response regulator transcription factor [Chloroflexota bacterium]MBM4451275.1 response regulator transcription factor [Chloroflexota bacterium]